MTATQVVYGKNNTRYEICLRGVGNTQISEGEEVDEYSKFTITGTNVYCEGDLLYLLDYNRSPSTAVDNYAYAFLFDGCAVLKSIPKMSLTALSNDCYG
jgi:hypothetical protein